MNCLVITADDFGLAREVNEAVEIGCSQGILSAASLMVSAAHADDAVARALRLPRLRVGLHLALTDVPPILPAKQIPRLIDGKGRLRSDLARFGLDLAMKRTARAQMREEIEAQFRAFRSTGLRLDHVNVHQHFHLHPVVAEMVLEIASQFGSVRCACLRSRRNRPARRLGGKFVENLCSRLLRRRAQRHGIVVAGSGFRSAVVGQDDAPAIASSAGEPACGFSEIYLHPATSDTFPGHAPGYRYVEELGALLDPANAEALRRSDRRLCGYRDVIDFQDEAVIQESKQAAPEPTG